ncbi:ABATE domain-containing protein [Streptomyces roseoverticillatus]|uniref:ABATE domain-containing protein n=1 Tax=Streptomyces roseoverticillatus TaxID=66429 RepID=UPI001F36FCD7|nr:ABATE domain-containing protein [Streptomyces roseoverticillatus]
MPTGGPGLYRRYEVPRELADLAAWADRSCLTPVPALEISQAEVADARRLRDALFRAFGPRARRTPPARRPGGHQ